MAQENKAFDVRDFFRRVGAIGCKVYATRAGNGWDYSNQLEGTSEELIELTALWNANLPEIRAYLIEHGRLLS